MRRATVRHGAEPWGAGWAPVVELEGRRVGTPPPGAFDRDYAEELAKSRATSLAEGLSRTVVIVEPLPDGLRASAELLAQLRQEAARIARVLFTAMQEHKALPPEVELAAGYAGWMATRLGASAADLAPATPG